MIALDTIRQQPHTARKSCRIFRKRKIYCFDTFDNGMKKLITILIYPSDERTIKFFSHRKKTRGGNLHTEFKHRLEITKDKFSQQFQNYSNEETKRITSVVIIASDNFNHYTFTTHLYRKQTRQTHHRRDQNDRLQ